MTSLFIQYQLPTPVEMKITTVLVAVMSIATASAISVPNDPSDADIVWVKKHFPDTPIDGHIAAT
jgi:hypothetical protein